MIKVAEQVGPIKKGMDKANGTWRLKTKTWLEVRPYEWSILSDSERAAMIRQARVAFDEMKIPKSDPVWHNIELRSAKNGIAASANANGSSSRGTSLNPGSSRGNSSNSGTSQLAETSKVEQARRAGPSADAKVKKAKAKAVPMPAKDESLKLPHAGSAAPADKNDRSIAPIDTDLRQESTARRPGSGYKSKPSPTTTAAGVHATSPNQGAGSTGGQSASKQRLSPVPPKSSAAMTPSSRSSSSVTDSRNQPPVKKNKAEPAELTERERSWEGRIPKKRPDEMASSSERDSKRGKERIRQPSTINGPSHGADAHDARPSDRDKRIPKTSNNGGIDSDRERERKKEPNTDRANNKGVQRLQERDRESAGRSPALGHFKRKVLGKDDDDFSESYTRKKLKPHEPETRSRSPPSKISAPDLSLPKRPDAQSPSTLPKQKFRKEPSPRPSPSGPSSSTSLSQSRPKDDSGKRHGTSKRRRRSPIYTSSEDESLASKPQPANVSNAISTPAQNMPPRPSLSASEPRSSVASDQSPTKLRLRYHKVYSEYLQTYQALVEEMRKNEELLARWSETEGSDEDVELLESEELRRLRSKYASLHAELVEIREICEGAGS